MFSQSANGTPFASGQQCSVFCLYTSPRKPRAKFTAAAGPYLPVEPAVSISAARTRLVTEPIAMRRAVNFMGEEGAGASRWESSNSLRLFREVTALLGRGDLELLDLPAGL